MGIVRSQNKDPGSPEAEPIRISWFMSAKAFEEGGLGFKTFITIGTIMH